MSPAQVSIPFLVSFLIMTSLALFAWQRRAQLTSRIFFVFTLLVLLWLGGFILEILSPTLAEKRFWSDFQFLGICFIPAAWCFLIVSYLGLPVRFRHLTAILLPLPVATNILIWTNSYHHLFRIDPWLDTETAAFPILVNDYGPWFYWVHVPFMYLLFFISVLLLVRAVFSKTGLYRNQMLLLLAALLMPLATDIAYVSGHSDATFSHGICPDCMKKLYPDYTKSGRKDPGDKEKNKPPGHPPGPDCKAMGPGPDIISTPFAENSSVARFGKCRCILAVNSRYVIALEQNR